MLNTDHSGSNYFGSDIGLNNSGLNNSELNNFELADSVLADCNFTNNYPANFEGDTLQAAESSLLDLTAQVLAAQVLTAQALSGQAGAADLLADEIIQQIKDQIPRSEECIFECKSLQLMSLFVDLRNQLPLQLQAFLTQYNLNDYSRMGTKLFLSETLQGGYGLNKDELISLFSLPGSGIGAELVQDAISRGARRLDCLDASGRLGEFYSRFGFEVIERQIWRDDLAPAGWNYQKFGRPDFLMMRLV